MADKIAGELTPKQRLADEFGVHTRTVTRWMRDPALEFPQPVRIRGRLFFARDAFEAWKDSRPRDFATDSVSLRRLMLA